MKIKKYMFSLILIILMLCTYSFATVSTSAYTITADSGFKEIGKPIISTLQIIASTVSIGCLAIIGIRFMIASPDQKANLKSSLVPYLIGAIMGFAIVPILSALYNIFA